MEKSSQKVAIVYARVSSHEQVGGTSLEYQEKVCKDHAQKLGAKVLRVFVEKGESAKTADRTEFNKAIALCSDKKSRVDYFIVYKIDRFARNQDDHAIVRANLRRFGTELRSASEPIDDTPTGRLMEAVIAGIAEFDNSVRAERSRNGMLEKARKGIWVHAAPIGYKRVVKGGNLVVDDKYASFVKLAFEEFAKGTHSYATLAEFLYERGFRTRTGNKVYVQMLEKMVHNPVYYGKIRAFGGEFEATFPAIVDEELFLKCQRGVYRKLAIGKREVENPQFPLRRFVVCSHCQKALTGSTSTGHKKARYPYYHHHKKGCPAAVSIPKETLEQNFIEYLQEISPRVKYQKSFRAIVLDIWQSNFAKLDMENERIRKEIKTLEAERQRVFDAQREGIYTNEEFLEQKDRIMAVIQQKKLLLEEKRIEEFNMDEALDYCFRFTAQSGKTWTELEDLPAYRLRFQNQVFPQKAEFDGTTFRNSKPSLIYEINQQSDADSSNVVSMYTTARTYFQSQSD